MDPSQISYHRIVIKLGTKVVIDAQCGAAVSRLRALIAECALLVGAGKEVLLVSSGAIGHGRQALGLTGQLSVVQKQACAAVGQGRLMDLYHGMFEEHKLNTAQVLLTSKDFSNRESYLSLRETLEELLRLKVVPIINENDTVSAAEIVDSGQSKSFGDNDKLSALVAGKLGADLLLILTDVDGVYSDNPKTVPEARLLREIADLSALNAIQARGTSSGGRGGMLTKLEAAKIAALCGVTTIISSGFCESVIFSALDRKRGSLIKPKEALSGRKRWIGLSSGHSGRVILDERACAVLQKGKASLLPVGVRRVEGEFREGEVISLQDQTGRELGRGIAGISAERLEEIKGLRSEEIENRFGSTQIEEVVHRDNLVIFDGEE
jgi:glutamate 5-kinase